ncbi:MAG: D-glycero-beta-D-manno-heptose 1,7-bisphosphate 7-phosphatase [Gammaproteobacteria bacterium]
MLVILDRDGVINYDSPDYIKSPAEWKAIPGSLEAIAKLNRAQHQVVIASNQSGLARGYFSPTALEAIHQKLHDELASTGGHIDGIFFCPHSPDDQCACRKPKPGLLQQIAQAFPDDFSQAVVIGDSLCDIQAAQAAGCSAWLVKTGNGTETLDKYPELIGQARIFKDLAEAVQSLLSAGSESNDNT